MIDEKQFRQIIRISLQPVKLYSVGAEQLLIATASVESDCGSYLMQKNNGPAVGIYQMEPDTFRDVWDYTDSSKYYGPIMDACNFKSNPTAIEMVTNIKFATIIARMNYYRFPEEVPDYNDVEGIWNFYKKRWNTIKGDTTKEEFMAAYNKVKF